MANTNTKPHVTLLSSPGLGHIIPVLELGKRIATLCNFHVTIFVPSSSSTSSAETEVIQSAMALKLCEIIELPSPDISNLIDPEATVVTRLCVMMREIKPIFRSALTSLKNFPVAIIVDFFCTESLEIAKEFGIPNYVFYPCSAWFVALTLYLPVLDKEIIGEYVDQIEPLKIPGCKSLRQEDVVDPMLHRTNEEYIEYVRIGIKTLTADGMLMNTWEALQSTTLDAITDENHLGQLVKLPVYPIGPLRRSVGPTGSNNELINWLDEQPKASVVYVSLGSGGTLSFEQMNELALGLELSKQRFIWVVKSPTVKSGVDESFFNLRVNGEDVSSYFSEGFLRTTKNIGKLVPNWAPQIDIISHKSIGLFLSHCGWNSTLESITNGVPMICWPLYAEQKMNATLLAEELGVAIKPKKLPLKEVVKREEIEKMIKRVMVDDEGNDIRKRVQELKKSGDKALREGGSSYNSLISLVNEWMKT